MAVDRPVPSSLDLVDFETPNSDEVAKLKKQTRTISQSIESFSHKHCHTVVSYVSPVSSDSNSYIGFTHGLGAGLGAGLGSECPSSSEWPSSLHAGSSGSGSGICPSSGGAQS